MPKCGTCGVEMDYNEHGEPMYVCTNRDCFRPDEVCKDCGSDSELVKGRSVVLCVECAEGRALDPEPEETFSLDRPRG